MRCQYVVQPQDTFEKIAIQFYNNPALGEKLRYYNGLYTSADVIVGQPIDIPLRLDLQAEDEMPCSRLHPYGYHQILDCFGNIYDFFDSDGFFDEAAWCSEMLATAILPFSVTLSLDRSRQIRKVRCHRKISGLLPDVFNAIGKAGYADKIITLGDVYNFRSKRTCAKLSPHCWGIALDINPEINAPGSKGCQPEELVELFADFGFTWGGHRPGKHRDPMHFQLGGGY